MNKPEPLTPRERIAHRRAALRARGLRPKQFWVADVRCPEFREQARRDSLAARHADSVDETTAFVEALFDWDALPPYDWGDDGPP
jgi:hypothetical protein